MHAISGRYFQRPITKSAKDKDRIPKKKPENKARCAPHLRIRTFFTTWIDYATWTSRCASLSRSTARGCTACCCLLLHAMTRPARASSPLMWDARTSVWALPPFHTFSISVHVFTSGETSRGFSKTFFLILKPPSRLLAPFKPFRCWDTTSRPGQLERCGAGCLGSRT